MPISTKALEILRTMVAAEKEGEYEDSEIVVEGRARWLGVDKVPGKVLDELVRLVAVSEVSEPGSLLRYTVNGTGKAIVGDPSVADRVAKALLGGGAFDERGDAVTPGLPT
jgi:hypothetical protein